MPLRDHFRSPLDDVHSWDELHGMWPAMIVRALAEILPEPYVAAPSVHLGTRWPTLTIDPRTPKQDVYEVRVYDSRRKRRLVAAIEIVSPSNKDCPETRVTFISKIADWLESGICVSIVDVVSTSDFNLYAELLRFVASSDPSLGDRPTPIYAATVRMRQEGRRRLMDNWYHPLAIGQVLPTLPIWLTPTAAISLDLESTYEESCRTLRIG